MWSSGRIDRGRGRQRGVVVVDVGWEAEGWDGWCRGLDGGVGRVEG